MKIATATLHAVHNYGSALQTLATQRIFEDMGLNAITIDYRREALKLDSILEIFKNKEHGWAMKLKLLMILPSTKKSVGVFERFLSRNIKMTEFRYSVEQDFAKNPIDADVFCTGSDQVWNTGWHKEVPGPFLLSFVPDGKKKIAFSASFGKLELEEWEKESFKKLLSRYDALSVREDSGVHIIEDLGISGAVHVSDPTMVAPIDLWNGLSEKQIRNKPYVLVYQLCNNQNFEQYAAKFAKEKGLELVRLCTRYDQARKPGKAIVLPEVEEFLSLIRYADYVLTDSFHCTSFSLMFHKRFLCFYPNAYGGRLDSILKMVDLQNRLVTDFENYDVADSDIDYNVVEKIIQGKREESMAFLAQAIQ